MEYKKREYCNSRTLTGMNSRVIRPQLTRRIKYAGWRHRTMKSSLTALLSHFAPSRGNAYYRDLTNFEVSQFEVVKNSGEFDANWYIQVYNDVRKSGVDPIYHYIKYGAKEGRKPNPWFDTVKYTKDSMQMSNDSAINPFVHYLESRQFSSTKQIDKGHLASFSDASIKIALERFDKFPLFSASAYLAMNEPLRNVQGLIPSHHALVWGIPEGRNVFRKDKVAGLLGSINHSMNNDTIGSNDNCTTLRVIENAVRLDGHDQTPAPKDQEIGVFYNTQGNVFLKEFAECVVFDLQAAGFSAVLCNELTDKAALPKRSIVVGPHEFFFIGNGSSFADESFLRNAVVLNTEQPQTIWFDRAVPFSLLSKGVIDISPQVANIYGETGIPTLHVDLSGAPINDVAPDSSDPMFRVLPIAARTAVGLQAPIESRPIDVSFFGAMSSHRERFFSRSARFLSDYETYIYCRRFTSPIGINGRDGNLTKLASFVARQSKITLNVHRDEYNFFEWHRIVRTGMDNGSLIVSEPCLRHPVFKPGVHFFEESGRHIHNLIEWLLRSPEGLARAEQVRTEASQVLLRFREANRSGIKIAKFMNACLG